MADAILDFAGLEDTADATAANAEPEVTVDLDAPEEGAEVVTEGAEKVETTEAVKDGDEKSPNNADGTPKDKTAVVKETDSTPQNVRKALKAMRDADPANAKIVKALHTEYERAAAYSKAFPKVADAINAKAFIDSVGGQEGWETAQATIKNIEETDELLYNGDAKTLVGNIVSDLKEQGKMDRIGALAEPLLEALREHDEKAFLKMYAPHFIASLEKVNLNGAISALGNTLAKLMGDDGKTLNPDALKTAKEIAADMKAWFDGEKKGVEAAKVKPVDTLAPEREKLTKERTEFETTKKKEFQESVGRDCEKSNNQKLGSHLKGYLQKPFFKEFPRATLIDLGNGIKQNLYAAMKADASYQTQMKAMWGQKKPDAAKIKEYHDTWLDTNGERIVRDTVQNRYPGYAKGGKAAGRVAAAATKTEATAKVDAAAAATGKPTYVAAKPKWESIDWEKDPKQLLYIAGKAYLHSTVKGQPGKFVTWRK